MMKNQKLIIIGLRSMVTGCLDPLHLVVSPKELKINNLSAVNAMDILVTKDQYYIMFVGAKKVKFIP